jgi:hypothetical protein
MLVPDTRQYELPTVRSGVHMVPAAAFKERMSTPGAATSTFSPRLEKAASPSPEWVAATVKTWSDEAGEKSA